MGQLMGKGVSEVLRIASYYYRLVCSVITYGYSIFKLFFSSSCLIYAVCSYDCLLLCLYQTGQQAVVGL